MSADTRKQVTGVSWLKVLIRILVVVLLLAGAIFLQHRLASFFPLSVEVEKSTPPFTPARAAFIKREELVVDHPSQQVGGSSSANTPGVLFSHRGKDFITVEAHFESARLGKDIVDLLRHDSELKRLPPEDRQQISYTTAEDETLTSRGTVKPPGQEEPCRTSIQVSPTQGTQLPTYVHFYPVELGSDRHLVFEVKAEGSDLEVELLTRNSTPNSSGEIQGPGCRKALSVGDWTYPNPFSSPLPLHIVVPAGTSFGFTFTAFRDKTPWSGESSYEPFELEASPLSASAVRKLTQGSPSTAPLFSASAVEGAPPLVLKHLVVRPDEVQLDFSGKAMVQESGKYVVTFDLWEFTKEYPLYAIIISTLITAFLNWLWKIAFRSRRVEQEPKKRGTGRNKKPKISVVP